MRPTIADKESLDVREWGNPDMHSMETKIHRAAEMRVLLEKLDKFRDYFSSAKNILELGGGYCWASCMVKWRYPDSVVVGSDITSDAFASTPFWERMYNVKVDAQVVCKSYDTGLPDGSQDLVFVFAAAHHFGRHRSTLKELSRILRPGGTALYLHEPACPKVWYPLAYRRANNGVLGYGVPEDLLLTKTIKRLAAEAGLKMTLHKDVTTTNRGPVQGIYYLILAKIPVLQYLMPCTVDLVFGKPE
jgi:SAM-dependent methyltransferase